MAKYTIKVKLSQLGFGLQMISCCVYLLLQLRHRVCMFPKCVWVQLLALSLTLASCQCAPWQAASNTAQVLRAPEPHHPHCKLDGSGLLALTWPRLSCCRLWGMNKDMEDFSLSLGQAKARSQKPLPGFPNTDRSPNIRAIFCCFFQVINSRELD